MKHLQVLQFIAHKGPMSRTQAVRAMRKMGWQERAAMHARLELEKENSVTSSEKMTKAERTELMGVIRKRERVLKQQATERSSKLMAEFEAHAAQIYSFNDEDVWKKATEAAKEAVEAAQKIIAKHCDKLQIPREFQPGLSFGWHGRGAGAAKERQAELRRKVRKIVEALEEEARSKIELLSLEAQEEIVAHGIQSTAAKAFLERMPKLEALMPSVNKAAIRALMEAKPNERGSTYLEHYE